VREYGYDGTLRRAQKTPLAPASVPARLADSVRTSIREGLTHVPGLSGVDAAALIRDLPVPSLFPHATDALLDTAGRVLTETPEPGGGRMVWRRIDTGVASVLFSTPVTFRGMASNGITIWGSQADTLGVDQIVCYGASGTGPPGTKSVPTRVPIHRR
jgi:hypothetical protein